MPNKLVCFVEKISLKPTVKRGKERKMPSKSPVGTIVATLEDDVIVLRIPLIGKDKRKPSSTGKSILCGNTRGPKIVRQLIDDELVPVEIDGQQLRVIASAYIPIPKSVSSPKE